MILASLKGSDFAALGKSLGDVINLTRPPFTSPLVNTRLLRSLQQDSHELLAIANDFKDRAVKLVIQTFFKQKLVPRLQRLIVEEASATIGLQHEIARPFWRDHRDLCRFNAQDKDYRAVLHALKDIIERRSAKVSEASSISTSQISYDEMEQKCFEYLNKPALAEYLASLDERLEGTFGWFDSCEDFKNWHQTSGSAVLWVSGYPGYGKTMLSTYLCDLLCNFRQSKVLLLRFFCSREQEYLCNFLSLTQSLLFQALERKRRLIKSVKRCSERGGLQNLGRSDLLWKIFEQFVKDRKTSKIYILIDGVDEFDLSAQHILIDKFAKLIASEPGMDLKLILTSRPECTAVTQLEGAEARFIHCQLQTYQSRINGDVIALVQARLARLVGRGICSSKVRDVLATQLIDQAESTFLWVTLALKTLERRRALLSRDVALLSSQLPAGLSDLYGQFLSSIEMPDIALAAKLLHFVSVSPTPLHGRELCLLATINSTHRRSNALEDDCEINDRTIQTLLGPLVRLSDGKVYLVHQSLQEYLCSLTGSTAHNLNHFALDIAQISISLSVACMHYLTLDDFSEDLVVAVGTHSERLDARELLANHASEDAFELSLFDTRMEEEDAARKQLSRVYPLYEFASVYGIRLFAANESHATIEAKTLLTSLYLGDHWKTINCVQQFAHAWGKHVPQTINPVILGAYFGTALHLKSSIGKAGEIPSREKYEALECAAHYGHDRCLQVLLETLEAETGKHEAAGNALCIAVANGQSRCVQVIVSDDNENARYRNHNGRTALSFAAEYNHPDILDLLLGGTSTLAGASDDKGFTPLMYAVFAASEVAVRSLCTSGNSNSSASCKNGRSALSWAAEDGNVAIIKELLNNPEIDLCSADKAGLTPLMYAVKYGCYQAATTLLDRDRTLTESRDNSERNALSHAASQSNPALVDLLLQWDSHSIEFLDCEGWGPLAWALDPPGSLENVVKLLQVKHVNINACDFGSGKTPLMWACSYGYKEIVRKLALEPNIDLAARDAEGRTALSHAAGGGFLDIVDFLSRSSPMDKLSRDVAGRSALDWATLQGHYDVVDLLADS